MTTIYSFSQIGVYQQCPKKYQYQYIDKIEKEFKSSPDLILGTSVHGGLERLYQEVNMRKIPTNQELLKIFHELWNKGIHNAGEKLQYKGDQPIHDYISRGEHYLTDYYDKYYPFSGVNVIGTELTIIFKINNKPFKGIIDRLDKNGDTYIINDYKTNKKLPNEYNNYREQLTLYGLGIKQNFGRYLKHINAKIHYLHFGLLDEWEITNNTISPIIEKYSKIIDEIDKAKVKYAESFNSDNQIFPAKNNSFCKFCEYKKLCPLLKNTDI